MRSEATSFAIDTTNTCSLLVSLRSSQLRRLSASRGRSLPRGRPGPPASGIWRPPLRICGRAPSRAPRRLRGPRQDLRELAGSAFQQRRNRGRSNDTTTNTINSPPTLTSLPQCLHHKKEYARIKEIKKMKGAKAAGGDSGHH